MPRTKYANDEERILRNVVRDANGCWIWQLRKGTENGYGYLGVARRQVIAHRFSYQLFVGPIPDGLTIDHLCRVRACVNPAHLEPVTIQTNIRRAPGQVTNINREKTHCKHGHPFSPENTGYGPGRRYCRICSRASTNRCYQRKILRAAGVKSVAA